MIDIIIFLKLSRYNKIFIEKNSIIDLIASGRFLAPENVEACVKTVENLGFIPRLNPKTFGPDLFYANIQQERYEAVREAIEAPDSKALWCLGGGYGTTRILSELAKN